MTRPSTNGCWSTAPAPGFRASRRCWAGRRLRAGGRPLPRGRGERPRPAWRRPASRWLR